MKKVWLPLVVIAVIALAGCTATLPKGGVTAADYSATEYEVLGPVQGKATTTAIFGGLIVMEPDAGYRAAYADALKKKPGAHALINVYSDVQVTQFLFGFYLKMETKVYGTAITVNDDKLRLAD